MWNWAAITSATSRSPRPSTCMPTRSGWTSARAIGVRPNNTRVFCEPEDTGAIVRSGPVMDGIGKWIADVIPLTDEPPVDVAAELTRTGTEILVNYLPVGSEEATRFYADEALKAGCAFVNCMPVFIASRSGLAEEIRTRPACPSSATTSRARSAPPSSTAC